MSELRRCLGSIGIGFVLFLFAGCGSGAMLRGGGPYLDTNTPNEGVRYYVGKDLLSIDVRKVITTQTKWNAACAADVPTTSDTALFQTSVSVVADRQRAFRLGLTPSGTVKQSLTVGVSEAGLLTGINYASEDKRAELIGDIVKGVAGIAGTVFGVAAAPDTTKPSTTPAAPGNEDCYLRESAGKSLKHDVDSLEKALKDVQYQRLLLLRDAAPKARTLREIAMIRGKDSAAVLAMTWITDQLSVARTAYNSGISAHARKNKVGVKVDTLPLERFTFDLSELATFDQTKDLPSDDARSALYQRARLAIVISDAPPSAANVSVDTGDTSPGSLSCTNASSCARLQYRIPRLRQLTVYSASDNKYVPVERTLVLLASSADPILNVGLDVERLGSGSVKLAFGRYGNLVSMEQVSEASAVAAGAAFVKAIADSRTEFQAGLQAVANAQTSVLALQQAARTARIKELQDQKGLLDSEIALQGAQASRELLQQKQQLDTELALLTSQKALAAASAPPAAPAAIDPVQAEINALRLQLDLLRAQIEIEKAKRDLDAAKRPPPGELP